MEQRLDTPLPQKLEIVVAALGGEGTDVSLDDFIAELEAIGQVLEAIDEDLHAHKTLTWKVVDLHHSDATVVLGGIALDQASSFNSASNVLQRFFGGVNQLARGVDAEELSNSALEGIRSALKPVGHSVRATKLRWLDQAVEIGIELKSAFEKVTFRNEAHTEEWQGLIEEINVHSAKPTFRLYPAVGPKWITCEFARDEIEKHKRALTHKASVYGKAVYRPNARYPHRIFVEEVTVLDEVESLDLMEFGGVFADSRREIFEQLAKIRDGWTE
ncbi:hypothetical protein [Microvirga lotononidis]|uniref:Uncharacterized protein n=1 Tax=Microvirga lotononidis TaxID=864069 RepID=I4YMA6_9HYPH|nr:hypothetical protein [Microvirga lotononidis]EIM25098.1 hypothetical protein MicloDRAFT_00058180 [Microvirga lotononidis]WQO29412.1 hypothetical protein U0023_10240 [Microvirga lotononidis]